MRNLLKNSAGEWIIDLRKKVLGNFTNHFSLFYNLIALTSWTDKKETRYALSIITKRYFVVCEDTGATDKRYKSFVLLKWKRTAIDIAEE